MADCVVRKSSFTGLLIVAAWIAVAVPILFGQANSTQRGASPHAANMDAKPLTFDAVSIKQNRSDSSVGTASVTPTGFRAVNMPLSVFFYNTFRREKVYGAPDWLQSERYDFEAKVASPDLDVYRQVSQDIRNRMLQAVFEDRLKLKVHRETRELPIYALVLAKNGSKLKEAKPGNTYDSGYKWPAGGIGGIGLFSQLGTVSWEQQLIGQGASMTDLARDISYAIDNRMVVDRTGLAAKYDFKLDWMPIDKGDGSVPSLFTALQEQLGLRLESTKGPVEVFVIDHIERPSEN